MNLCNLFKKPMYLVYYKYETKCKTMHGYGSYSIKGNFSFKAFDVFYKKTEDLLMDKYGKEFKFNIAIVNICKLIYLKNRCTWFIINTKQNVKFVN